MIKAAILTRLFLSISLSLSIPPPSVPPSIAPNKCLLYAHLSMVQLGSYFTKLIVHPDNHFIQSAHKEQLQ
jgi:hypothetical protein